MATPPRRSGDHDSAGSTSVPVTSVAGFAVGQKIALGYGATYPAVAGTTEQYEVATVTAVGKPGTQAYLGADAPAGSTNIKVTSVANISVGDKIRLDIDSVGHGIETVTVTRVGTQASRAALSADASAGATNIKVRNVNGFAVGDKIIIGAPGRRRSPSPPLALRVRPAPAWTLRRPSRRRIPAASRWCIRARASTWPLR